MHTTFSDDTTSGRWACHLRGIRRVTVLARADDPNGFEWLQALKLHICQNEREVKSSFLLPVLDTDSRIRNQVLKNVEAYAIFIVDLHEQRRQLLDPVINGFKPWIPLGQDPYEFVFELLSNGSGAQMVLRQMLLNQSILGQLESVLECAADPWIGPGVRREYRVLSAPSWQDPRGLSFQEPSTM